MRMIDPATEIPSAMAGKTFCWRLSDGLSVKLAYDWPLGSQGILVENRRMSSVPSQKFGIDSPIKLKIRDPTSGTELGRSADSVPSGMPMSSATTSAQNAN